MQENEYREVRDMLIEMRVTLMHLTNQFATYERNNDARLRLLESKVSVLERNLWIATGAIALATQVIPWILGVIKK